jgi:hypothetical protein
MNNFHNFIASLESMHIENNGQTMSPKEQAAIGNVYGFVKEFMVETNLVPAEQIASLESFDTAIKSLNNTVSLNDIGGDRIVDLCRNCGIGAEHLRSAAESVSLCIYNYANGYGAAKHFASASPSSAHGDFEMRGMDTMFSKGAIESLISTPNAALESFGAYIDQTIADAKVAITVSILRYHRSILHRLIPNIPTDSNVVTYKVDNMEVYDLTKSRSNQAAVRYDDKHRVPFVDLYRDPSPANTALKPIILRVANDAVAPNNRLIAENIVKIGKDVNMFDYTIDAGTIGYEHIDYTDLVGDSVRLKNLYFSVTDGTNTELIPVAVIDHSGARMIMTANNSDSADRVCSLNDVTSMTASAQTIGGAASALLAGFSVDAVVRLAFNAAGSVNLKTSKLIVHGSADAALQTKSGNAPIGADATLFGTLTFTLVGYQVDAQFSEENVRKTTKSLRILTKQVGYEIPGSANFIVQYSLTQSRPETVVDGLTKLMSIGIDDRGVKMLMDSMASVRDRITAEQNLASDNYVNKVGSDFVAGQRVKPYIYMDTLVIDPNLVNMRSGEKWGDIRSMAEEFLLNVLVRIFNESYYTNEIGAGEKPVFSVLTSPMIKDSLLSVPHYHSHLGDSAKDAVADGVVEFRRTLPNGTILNVISTTFDYMADKMLIMPVRPNSPQSVLNFAQNRERGTYLSQATPSVDGAIYNQLIGNARESVIITNPVGALLSVSNLSAIFAGMGSLGV